MREIIVVRENEESRDNSYCTIWMERVAKRERETNKSKGRFDPIDSTTQITGINRTALWLLIATRARNRVHPGYKRDETHAAPGGIRTSKTNVIKAIARRAVSAFSSPSLSLSLSLATRERLHDDRAG